MTATQAFQTNAGEFEAQAQGFSGDYTVGRVREVGTETWNEAFWGSETGPSGFELGRPTFFKTLCVADLTASSQEEAESILDAMNTVVGYTFSQGLFTVEYNTDDQEAIEKDWQESLSEI